MGAENGVNQEYPPGIYRSVSEFNKIKKKQFHQLLVGIKTIQFLRIFFSRMKIYKYFK
jgi:hypothetical protein